MATRLPNAKRRTVGYGCVGRMQSAVSLGRFVRARKRGAELADYIRPTLAGYLIRARASGNFPRLSMRRSARAASGHVA